MKHELELVEVGRGFPADLRCRVPAQRLLHLVLEAVSQLETGRAVREFRHGGASYNFNQLLATLSYAYLIGLYDSEELEAALDRDPELKYLATGSTPSAATFRRFRRLHRGPLGVMLLRVLARLAAGTGSAGASPAAVPASPAKPVTDRVAMEVLTQSAVEAEARLSRAVFADMVAGED